MFDLILELHHILISEGLLWEDNPEMINANYELALVLGRKYVYLPELPKLLRPQITRVSRPPPAISEDDDGTITAWLASMYNPRTSLQSLYNPPPLDMLVTIRSSLRSILSVQHPHMVAKSVYFFSEVMEMVLDYMVTKKERMFGITEPLVAWVGGDPLGAVLQVSVFHRNQLPFLLKRCVVQCSSSRL
jgi:hypothetical protein